ncbi:hypothetical protein HaLaN_13933, partial [Haematococcus lacustris]
MASTGKADVIHVSQAFMSHLPHEAWCETPGLHNAMMSSFGGTHNLKEELEQELAKARDEHARAAA